MLTCGGRHVQIWPPLCVVGFAGSQNVAAKAKNMTQGSVSASKPFSSQSELRPDKLFQDQPILWFYLQTRLSTRGHCVSVSGLTHLHEGAVSSLFSSIVKKKNHKSEISWQKNVYSLKKIHLIFFHSSFFLHEFFSLGFE